MRIFWFENIEKVISGRRAMNHKLNLRRFSHTTVKRNVVNMYLRMPSASNDEVKINKTTLSDVYFVMYAMNASSSSTPSHIEIFH